MRKVREADRDAYRELPRRVPNSRWLCVIAVTGPMGIDLHPIIRDMLQRIRLPAISSDVTVTSLHSMMHSAVASLESNPPTRRWCDITNMLWMSLGSMITACITPVLLIYGPVSLHNENYLEKCLSRDFHLLDCTLRGAYEKMNVSFIGYSIDPPLPLPPSSCPSLLPRSDDGRGGDDKDDLLPHTTRSQPFDNGIGASSSKTIDDDGTVQMARKQGTRRSSKWGLRPSTKKIIVVATSAVAKAAVATMEKEKKSVRRRRTTTETTMKTTTTKSVKHLSKECLDYEKKEIVLSPNDVFLQAKAEAVYMARKLHYQCLPPDIFSWAASDAITSILSDPHRTVCHTFFSALRPPVSFVTPSDFTCASSTSSSPSSRSIAAASASLSGL